MTLPAFATSDEIAARLGATFSTAEAAQADAFCGDASDLIRDYCRQNIGAQTGVVMTREAPDGPWLDLPQRPVTAVSLVQVNGHTIDDYSKIGDRLYRVFGWRWPSVDTVPPLAIYGLKSTVAVTYDAGFADIPGVISATCRRMVMRAMANPSGLTRETIDDYTAERADGTAGVYLDEADKRGLRRYRRGAFSADLGSAS